MKAKVLRGLCQRSERSIWQWNDWCCNCISSGNSGCHLWICYGSVFMEDSWLAGKLFL